MRTSSPSSCPASACTRFSLHVPELRHVCAVLNSANMRCHAAAVVLKQGHQANAPRSQPSTERRCDSAAADNVRVLCICSSRGNARYELLKLRAVNWKVEPRPCSSSDGPGRTEYVSYGQLQISRRWPLNSVTRVIQHEHGDPASTPRGDGIFVEVFTLFFKNQARAFSFRSIDHESCTALIVKLIELSGCSSAPASEPALPQGGRRPRAAADRHEACVPVAESEGTATTTELVSRLSAAVSRQADLLDVMLDRHQSGTATREERDKLLEVCERARERLSDAVVAACAANSERVLEETLSANDKMCAVVQRARREDSRSEDGGAMGDAGSARAGVGVAVGEVASSAPPFEQMDCTSSDLNPARSRPPAFFLQRMRGDSTYGGDRVGGSHVDGWAETRAFPASPAQSGGDHDPISGASAASEKGGGHSSGSRCGIRSAVPGSFICPITLELFVEPVVAADGHTYEKEAIRRWLSRAGQGAACSPMTGYALNSLVLTPNFQMKAAIEEWRCGSGVPAHARASVAPLSCGEAPRGFSGQQEVEHPPLIVL